MKALKKQVGGNWYKRMVIQPIEFIMANDLSFIQGNFIKYGCRYKYRGTPIKDLEKIKHYADLEIERLKSKGIK